jgi:hypothetical protein
MARTIKITLGEQEYEVPRINIGQTEDLAEFWEKTDATGAAVDAGGEKLRGKPLIAHTLAIAAILLRRATPPIGDLRELECRVADVELAMMEILRFNRFLESARGNGEAGASPAP